MKFKHLIRDAFIYLVSVTGITFVYQQFMRRKGPLVRILAFHDVADKKWFEGVVDMLIENYAVVTPEQCHEKNFDPKRINVLLTFDDGYQSWIDNCLPVLKGHNIKGLFFINSGLLDIAEDSVKVEEYMKTRLLISPKKPLTVEGARKLVSEGHTIGGHTMRHLNLAKLDEEAIKHEVRDDKYTLEERMKNELRDFAYPFGNLPKRGEELVKECGYTFQYSAQTGWYTASESNLIKRTLLEQHQSLASVKRWIEGGYDIFNFII